MWVLRFRVSRHVVSGLLRLLQSICCVASADVQECLERELAPQTGVSKIRVLLISSGAISGAYVRFGTPPKRIHVPVK